LYYDLREFTNALADFRKSCELGSPCQDDSFFHAWLVRARLGEKEAATEELQTYWNSRQTGTLDDWPSKIGSFLTGQLAEPDFLKEAENSDKQKDNEQHCEAYFYAGSKRLLEGDKITATDYFEKCRPTDVKDFSEYQSATAELKSLKVTK
jgi:lipoprotein NlpI